MQRSSQDDIRRAKEGLGWFGGQLVDAGASAAQLLGDTLLGAGLGPGGGTLPLALRTFGSGTMEARQGGGTLGQQLLTGDLFAGTELLTEKLSSATLPFKLVYGDGNPALEHKLDTLVAQAVRKFAGTPTGQRVLGGALQAGKSFALEGLEEFVGDWLQWQLPRLYGGDVNSFSDQLAGSLNSFFTGGLVGLFGAGIDPGTFNFSVDVENEPYAGFRFSDQRGFKQPSGIEQKNTKWQSYLDAYDQEEFKKAFLQSENNGTINPNEVFFRLVPTGEKQRFGFLKRPTWQKSEVDVGNRFPKYSRQVSFKDGIEVPYGTPGSVRPDFYISGSSIEVKNYNVSSTAGRRSLINNVLSQYQTRLENMPPNTEQTVVADVRGQGLSYESMVQLYIQLQTDINHRMKIRILID